MVSLRKQFFKHTTLAVLVIVLISVVAVDYHNVTKLKQSAQETLRLHVYAILSVAAMDDDELYVPTILSNPEFNTESSGLWAVMFDAKKNVLWQSLSSPNEFAGAMLASEPGLWWFSEQTINDTEYMTTSFKIVWGEEDKVFQILVAEDASYLTSDINDFRMNLFTGYIAITLSLLVLQFLALRFAFRPISKLESEISAMEQGKIGFLSHEYPKELMGVTTNLNALIDKEHTQRERYREAMADLAHSLKTPITIISGELNNYPDNPTLKKALSRMNDNIEYQLQRAVISGHKVLSQGMPVVQVLNLVLEAMEKIHKERPMIMEVEIPEEVLFHGDENDLLEVLGNLVDNSFKYGLSRVHIKGRQTSTGVEFSVEDDGPGLTPEQQKKVFTRGERLDQQGLGQGIGLAVVYDIIKGYKGNIMTSHSTLGGAKFTITLPHNGLES